MVAKEEAPLSIVYAVSALMLVAAGLYWLPRIAARPGPSNNLPLTGQTFPAGFLWGTGEDAYQHEGGNDRADWYAWERSDPRPFADGSVSGACVDFWNRYEEDFARASADGQNFHRIGIEWSRVEPTPGCYDESAFGHYRLMLESLKAKGMRVAVNLWHFTLPAWAAAAGAWENPDTMMRWEAYTAECGRRFGNLVDYWSTMIDAQIYVLRGYFTGEIPPLKHDPAAGVRVLATLAVAHGRAYRILKPYGGKVGMIYFFSLCQSGGNPLDAFVTGQFDRIFNWDLPDALHTGRLRVAITGVPQLDETIPEAAGTLDWLGVNYYYREIIRFNPKAQGLVDRGPAPGAALTDLGWEIYPEGMYRLCKALQRRYPGVPLMITENGIADRTDEKRPRFILDHLAWVHRLLSEGCPIASYSYWSGTDNLEWLDGFTPKFGLYRVDLRTMERLETASARLYRFIATSNRLPAEPELAGILDPPSQAG
jgi:beta-glucosidase